MTTRSPGSYGSPVDRLARAVRATEGLIASVHDDQWARPTACGDWTVRDLVNHLVVGMRLFAAIVDEQSPDRVAGLRPDRAGDVLGHDPLSAYRAAAEFMLRAFGQPGALTRMVTLPIGELPGEAALHLRVVESLVHGWDLTRATGLPDDLPEDLAEEELPWSQSMLTQLPPGRTPFGPSQPAPADAKAIDRLAALLGRDVTAR